MKFFHPTLLVLAIEYYKRKYGYSRISNKVVFAQAHHETGGFTSRIFKEGNNLFGMLPSRVRTFHNGTISSQEGQASYKNWCLSVRDYFARQKQFRIDNTSDSRFIDKTVASGYAADKNYKSKWLKIISSVKVPSYKLLISFFFGLILLISFAFLYFKKK